MNSTLGKNNVEPLEQTSEHAIANMSVGEIRQAIERIKNISDAEESEVSMDSYRKEDGLISEQTEGEATASAVQTNAKESLVPKRQNKRQAVGHVLNGYAVVCQVNEGGEITDPLILGFDTTEQEAIADLSKMASNFPAWIGGNLHVVPATLHVGTGSQSPNYRQLPSKLKMAAAILLSAGFGAGFAWLTVTSQANADIAQREAAVANQITSQVANQENDAVLEYLVASNNKLKGVTSRLEELSLTLATLKQATQVTPPATIATTATATVDAPKPVTPSVPKPVVTLKKRTKPALINTHVIPLINEGNTITVNTATKDIFYDIPTQPSINFSTPSSANIGAANNKTLEENYEVVAAMEGRAIVKQKGETKVLTVGDKLNNGKTIKNIDVTTKLLTLE